MVVVLVYFSHEVQRLITAHAHCTASFVIQFIINKIKAGCKCLHLKYNVGARVGQRKGAEFIALDASSFMLMPYSEQT